MLAYRPLFYPLLLQAVSITIPAHYCITDTMSKCSFLDLPVELIREILLCHLSTSDMGNIRLQNKYLHGLIDDILRIIYHKELKRAALVDCFPSNTSFFDRLFRLRRRENAWTSFRPTNNAKIVRKAVIYPGHGKDYPCLMTMHDLNNGHFLIGVPGTRRNIITAIYYHCLLPREQFPEPIEMSEDDPPSPHPAASDAGLDVDEGESDIEDVGEVSGDAQVNAQTDGMDSTETEAVSAESDEDDASMSSMHSYDHGSHAIDGFADWDVASAGLAQSVGSPQPPSRSMIVRGTLWRWIPYIPHQNDEILCFKLAVEESNLLVVVTS